MSLFSCQQLQMGLVLHLLRFRLVLWKLNQELEVLLRTKELVKLRLTMGLTAARRAAANAERWRNMAASIEFVVVWYDILEVVIWRSSRNSA